MTQVTVEEPRSVVEEVQKYECDSCSHVVDKEHAHFVKTVPVTDSGGFQLPSSSKTAHLCDNCIEADSYMSYMDLIEKQESRMELLADGLNKSLYVLPTSIAISLSASAALFPRATDMYPLGGAIAEVIMIFPFIFMFVVMFLMAISTKTSLIKEE